VIRLGLRKERKKERSIDPWALRFLLVREIDCGDWLARKYMPAHQHSDLSRRFAHLLRIAAWVCHELGNAPVLRSGTGFWVLLANGVLAIRLVQ